MPGVAVGAAQGGSRSEDPPPRPRQQSDLHPVSAPSSAVDSQKHQTTKVTILINWPRNRKGTLPETRRVEQKYKSGAVKPVMPPDYEFQQETKYFRIRWGKGQRFKSGAEYLSVRCRRANLAGGLAFGAARSDMC